MIKKKKTVNEINFSKLLYIIKIKKLNFFFIMMFCILINTGLNYYKPNTFVVYKTLKLNEKSITNDYIFMEQWISGTMLYNFSFDLEQKFFEKIEDKNTILLILKKNTYVQSKIKHLSKKKQKKILNDLVPKLIKKETNDIILSINYFDIEEGKKILDFCINEVIKDLKFILLADLENIFIRVENIEKSYYKKKLSTQKLKLDDNSIIEYYNKKHLEYIINKSEIIKFQDMIKKENLDVLISENSLNNIEPKLISNQKLDLINSIIFGLIFSFFYLITVYDLSSKKIRKI